MQHPKFGKLPLKQWGWLAWAIPAAASLLGGELANESREDAADETTKFNAAQAALTREYNTEEAEKARAFSAVQADRQMGFQREMSNTAYQRTMQDMKAAGLNPMLAYSQGGASTPSGAQGASAQANASAATGVTPSIENTIAPAVATALQFKQAEANIDNIRAQTQNTVANTDVQNAQRNLVTQQAINEGTRSDQIVATTANIKEQTKQIASQTTLNEKQVEKILQDVKESYAREDMHRAETVLKKLSVAEAKAFEQYYKSLGQASPFVKFILGAIQAIRGSR